MAALTQVRPSAGSERPMTSSHGFLLSSARSRQSDALLNHRKERDPSAGSISLPGMTSGQVSGRQLVESVSEGELAEMADLPPITQIKDAITRSRLCKGMAYILPVDKSRNSIENVYRTDLRYMFRQPYRDDMIKYNENKVRASLRHHFAPNVPTSRYQHHPDDYTKYVLNSDSEQIRRELATSAPPKGLLGKHNTPSSPELRTRSSLYQPIKTKLPPEALRIKEEADRILQSVQAAAEAEYDQNDTEMKPASRLRQRDGEAEQGSRQKQDSSATPSGRRVKFCMDIETKGIPAFTKKTQNFKTYDELKCAQLDIKALLPKSKYLSDQKNSDIWEWMTKGEAITDFNFFLNMCS